MTVKWHKRAWECPGCKKFLGVNRRSVGCHIRKCPHCRTATIVTTKIEYREIIVSERVIVVQPVEL